MKKMLLSAAIALSALLSTNTLLAQSPHFITGPDLKDNGTTLSVSGSIAGLGNNQNLTITLIANGTVTTICTNKGGNVAPGQTKVLPLSVSGEFSSGKNGRVNFSLTTQTPEPGPCPNGNWRGSVADVSFAGQRLLVLDAAGSTLFDISF